MGPGLGRSHLNSAVQLGSSDPTLRHGAYPLPRAILFHKPVSFPLRLERVNRWERIASRWRPAFSSHLINGILLIRPPASANVAGVTEQRIEANFSSQSARSCPCLIRADRCGRGCRHWRTSSRDKSNLNLRPAHPAGTLLLPQITEMILSGKHKSHLKLEKLLRSILMN